MRSHREKMASLTPERRARIEERAKIALREIRAVRELREQLGLTQGEFADRVGVSQSRVSRQDAGERRLSLEDFASYVQALGGEPALCAFVHP